MDQALAARAADSLPPPPPPLAETETEGSQDVGASSSERGTGDESSGSVGWFVLALFFPVVGLVLWLVWNSSRRVDAVRARNGFITGLALSLVVSIAAFVVPLVAFRSAVSDIDDEASPVSRPDTRANGHETDLDDDLPAPASVPVQTVKPGPATGRDIAVPLVTESMVTVSGDEAAETGATSVRLTSLRPVQTQAYERGDSTGPGLAVTFVVTNSSDADLDLLADVNLYSGTDAHPGVPMSLDGHNSPFAKAKLAPGESAERTAVFATPNAAGTPVAVMVLIGDLTAVFQATVS